MESSPPKSPRDVEASRESSTVDESYAEEDDLSRRSLESELGEHPTSKQLKTQRKKEERDKKKKQTLKKKEEKKQKKVMRRRGNTVANPSGIGVEVGSAEREYGESFSILHYIKLFSTLFFFTYWNLHSFVLIHYTFTGFGHHFVEPTFVCYVGRILPLHFFPYRNLSREILTNVITGCRRSTSTRRRRTHKNV